MSVAFRLWLCLRGCVLGLWGQWYDFKASAILQAAEHALHAGNGLDLAAQLWAGDDDAIVADGSDGTLNSLQFMAGMRVRWAC
jgi:hypothetical protein